MGQPIQARQILKKLLDGRLVFTPSEDGTVYVFEGRGKLEPVLAGVVEGASSAKANGTPWSHDAPRACADESWVLRA